MTPIEESIVTSLKEKFGSQIKEAKVNRARRVSVLVEAGSHKAVISYLKEAHGPAILSAITATDMRSELEVCFSIWCYEKKTYVLIKSKIPRENPIIESIVDLIPGSTLYEREAHELLGVDFKGHPNQERLLLPDDWPEGSYPLRKDWKPQEVA